MVVWCAICAAANLSAAAPLGTATAKDSAAKAGAFAPKITDVTVFKDGHALVLSCATAQIQDGWIRTREVPVPVLGTFWSFVNDPTARIDFVKAGLVETDEQRPAMNFDEIVQANIGRKAVIVEQPKENPPVTHRGILRGILKQEPAKDADQPPAAAGPKPAALASYVMLESRGALELILRENVRGISLEDKEPATSYRETKNIREISMRVLKNGQPANQESEVGFIYLQEGIRWIPDYRIQLLDGGKAKVSLQATVINELADLDDVSLRLVVGVPSFLMKDEISPMALREVELQLGAWFGQPRPESGPGGRARFLQRGTLSNVAMSQYAGEFVERESRPAPSVPTEGQQEDLYLYQKDGISLRKGERAVAHLLEVEVPYEDIYVWEIPPVPPREVWRHVNSDQQRQLQNIMTESARAMHKIRLDNTGKEPWTTGPAMIFKGATPLGQQLVTYTSPVNTVDVAITVATDLNTKKEETETGRQLNVKIGDEFFTKVSLHGKLIVKNFKDKEVDLRVNRKTLGFATAATADGKIRQSNFLEDRSLRGEVYPWLV
jgi:hypothetical protein